MSTQTIIQGDCLEVMKTFADKSFDLVLTDPPYGIGFQSSWKIERLRKEKIANDDRPFTDFIPEVSRVLKEGGVLVCFTRYDTEEEFRVAMRKAGLKDKAQIIWDKVVHGMGDLFGDIAPQHENAIFAVKGDYKFPYERPRSIFRVPRVSPDKLLHPNEKPVELMAQLIQVLTIPEANILDCFTGSAPVLVAAKQLNRNAVAIEISPEYCKIAQQRLDAQATPMF